MDLLEHPESESDLSEDENPSVSPERELLWACEKGHIDVVKRIILEHPKVINCHDKDQYTPLHRAAYSNHNTIVKLLLHYGANPDARTVDGWTPLHSACKWANLECVRPLARACFDINATSNSGQTPLHLAATHPSSGRTLKYLLRQPNLKRDLQNSTGDTPRQLAERAGPFAPLFDTVKAKNVPEELSEEFDRKNLFNAVVTASESKPSQ